MRRKWVPGAFTCLRYGGNLGELRSTSSSSLTSSSIGRKLGESSLLVLRRQFEVTITTPSEVILPTSNFYRHHYKVHSIPEAFSSFFFWPRVRAISQARFTRCQCCSPSPATRNMNCIIVTISDQRRLHEHVGGWFICSGRHQLHPAREP